MLIDLELVDLGAVTGGVALVSAVSLGELAFGLDVGDEQQRSERTALLRDVVNGYEILPFGVEEAKLYGVLATLVRLAGRNPRPRRLDLQIAATAAAATAAHLQPGRLRRHRAVGRRRRGAASRLNRGARPDPVRPGGRLS